MLCTVVGVAIVLYQFYISDSRHYCPPVNFQSNSRRSISGFRTAIITEIHGKIWAKTHQWGPSWKEYHHGDQLARNIYNHAGLLGVDKIYLGVFYNESLYPKGPTVEDIYPSDMYCVVDWQKLGILDWRPLPYGGPVENWPLDKYKKPTQDRDYYKTLRMYNPVYAEIRNQYDWVFVMDPDEQITPVNFNVTKLKSDWCHFQQPPLVSRILEQMLIAATRHKLKWYDVMMNATRDRKTLKSSDACAIGFSFSEYFAACRPITSIYLPVYLWTRRSNSSEYMIPTIRSIYPGSYSDRLKDTPKDGQEEWWKSVYQTKYSKLLQGRALHENPIQSVFTILAPRNFHGGLSLELIHERNDNYWSNRTAKMMMYDRRLVTLTDAYKHCMKGLMKE